MIADYLYNVVETDVTKIIGELNSSQTIAMAFIEQEGSSPIYFFGPAHDSIYRPTVKIVVRHTSYQSGSAEVESVLAQLDKYHDDTLLSVIAVGAPMYIGRLDNQVHEFQVTFSILSKE